MFRTGRRVISQPCFRPRLWMLPARTHSLTLRQYSAATIPPVTKIEKLILDSIKATGPIPFSTYMQLCLSHPTDGYYMNPANSVFGSRGDFTTSPEISQVFGELVGIWLLSQWMSAGKPPAIRLIELGPGRGTLMDDILRVISQFPALQGRLKRVHLVETSLAMRSLQQTKLDSSCQKIGCEIQWHDSIDDIPCDSNEYTMLVAHEFFDALPIHVLQKAQQGWQEVLIASSPDATVTDSESSREPSPSISSSPTRLRHVLSPTPTAASTLLALSSSRFQNLPEGSTIEVSPASFKIARYIGELLGCKNQGATTDEISPGGCGLVIDYGSDQVFGNSFRAFKDHKIVDVFHKPGECDLTANVDFAYLKEAMADLVTTLGPISQSNFLERMGLQLRVEALTRAAQTEDRKTAIMDAARRLADQTGMGKEYQVLGITSARQNSQNKQVDKVWPFVDNHAV